MLNKKDYNLNNWDITGNIANYIKVNIICQACFFNCTSDIYGFGHYYLFKSNESKISKDFEDVKKKSQFIIINQNIVNQSLGLLNHPLRYFSKKYSYFSGSKRFQKRSQS